MLGREVADLSGLGADELMGVIDVVVDEFLILDVDQWREEGDGREE